MGNTQNYIEITYCQISKLNNNGKYILFDKKYIYDVTDYLYEHPGSDFILRKRAQLMISIDKDLFYHSNKAKLLSKKFIIGEIAKCTKQNCIYCQSN